MKNIITIQHTQAEHHITNMIGGNTDWPLTETGRNHAHNIGKNIRKLINENTVIFSSDLLRAKQTTDIINSCLNLAVFYRQELREINVGEAKGKSKEWARQNSLARGNVPLAKYRQFPGAETFEDVYNRTAPIVDEILAAENENIIVVGHGCALIMFLLQWLKIPVDFLDNIAFESKAGAVSFLSIWENKRMLNKWNITSFIED